METYTDTIQFGQFTLLHQTQVFGGMVGETHTVELLFIVKDSEIIGGSPQVESITYDQAIQMAVDYEYEEWSKEEYFVATLDDYGCPTEQPPIEKYEGSRDFGFKYGNLIDYLKDELFGMSPEGIEQRQRDEEADAISRVI